MPRVSEDLTEDMDGVSSGSDDQPIISQPPSSSTSRPRKRARSKPEKEATRGRNRSDLPPQYSTSSNTQFDDFLQEVQYLYGLELNPWGHLAITLVQRGRDKVFTGFQDILTAKGAVFRNVRHNPLILFALPNPDLQAKASLSPWRRAFLKKAEKVIDIYFKDEARFPTATDIARQAQFLLGDAKVIPWLFKNGPSVMKVEDLVRTLTNMFACL